MARIDELRLMAKIARMYYTQGLRQTEICERLNIHQSTVSRVLKRAEREGIVRINGEPAARAPIPKWKKRCSPRFGLDEAVVVDCLEDEAQIAHDLGAAAAFYLENTLKPSDVIGISSWSAALLAHGECHAPQPALQGYAGHPDSGRGGQSRTRRCTPRRLPAGLPT